MQADHRVEPYDDQQKRLAWREIGPQDPQGRRVTVVEPAAGIEAAGAGDVPGRQERDRKAERDLCAVPRRETPAAASGEFPQRQPGVQSKRAVQQD
jgi:hypothetical protein